ncbi:MAG: Nucleoporin nup93, partial [Marteilia pararefringens]
HHSVHFALAFNEMGIINIFSNRNSLNIIEASQANGAGSHSLNLSKLFLKYTSRFETSDQRLAFEYYYALDCCSLIDNQIANVSKMGSSRDSTALQQSATISTESLFIELVCSLVLKTRDYDFVFGVEDEDGKLKNGYISRFNCSNDFQTDMIHIAAKMSEKSGLINDALHFYKLSKRFNKLSVLLSRRFVSLFDKTDCFERKSLMEFTTNNLEALHKETIDISIRGTVSILFKCSKIYDLFNQNYFEEAFIAFQALHVLPFTLDQVQTALRQYLGQNKILQDAMPNIALLLSRIIQKLKLLYSKKLEDCHLVISDNSRRLEEKLRSLGQASDALQSFISQLPTSLSSYLCSEIVRNLQYIV